MGGPEGETLYHGLLDIEFSNASSALSDFQKSILSSLADIREIKDDGSRSRRYKRNLICELVVVYKKAAIVYPSNGDVNFIRKLQNPLSLCVDLK